jgi:glycosyltransferase involved in cell wall biosynthesis
VAALIDTYDVSGPGRQLVGVAGALAERGVEVHVVMFHRAGRSHPPFADYMTRLGTPFTIVPENGPADAALPGRLRRVLRDLRPDVVETHSYKTTALVYLLRRLGGLRQPWLGFFHGATSENAKVRAYHWLDGRLLRDAERTVVMSEKHRREFAHLGSRVRVLYNSVVPMPDEPTAELLLPPAVEAAAAAGDPLVGVVGRLSPEKGVDIYLHALARLEGRGVRFMSVLAGDGPERAACEALAAELGLSHRVAFLGTVASMQSLYRRLELLVIPSRSEGLPNVLLEAMRADVPVVSTSVGAVPEVLGGTHAGVLVPPVNVEALADAIAASLHLKSDATSRTSRAEVATRFSLDHRAAEHVRTYRELVEAAAPGTAA